MSWLSRWIREKVSKRFAPMIKLGGTTAGAFSKAFYKRYGEEALPIIAEVMGEYGAESAKIARGMLRGKGMKAVCELFEMMEMMDIFKKMDIIELSDDVLHIKSSPCPWCLEGTTRELCEAIDKKMMKQIVSTLIGQEAGVEIPKSVAAGDEYCEVVVSINK